MPIRRRSSKLPPRLLLRTLSFKPLLTANKSGDRSRSTTKSLPVHWFKILQSPFLSLSLLHNLSTQKRLQDSKQRLMSKCSKSMKRDSRSSTRDNNPNKQLQMRQLFSWLNTMVKSQTKMKWLLSLLWYQTTADTQTARQMRTPVLLLLLSLDAYC